MELIFERCLEMLVNGKDVMVMFEDEDFMYLGIKDNYCWMCLEGREEKCKVENVERFFKYLSNEEGFEEEEIEDVEEIEEEEFLDMLEFLGKNNFIEI